MKSINFIDIVSYLSNYDLTISIQQDEFDRMAGKPSRRKITYTGKCGHLIENDWTNLKQRDDPTLCVECCNTITHEKVDQEFRKHALVVLTTREEFELQIGSPCDKKIDYVAACNHKNQTTWRYFHRNESNSLLCKECVVSDAKILMSNRSLNTNEVESDGYQLLRNYMHDFIKIQTPEGSKADFMVKPKSAVGEAYMKLQLKVTQTRNAKHKSYLFKSCSGYTDMILVLICTDEEKFWIVPGKDVHHEDITIGLTQKSYYSKYSAPPPQISAMLQTFYSETQYSDSLESAWLSTSKTLQCSYDLIRYREEQVHLLNFERPSIENGVTDFYVGKAKFQEKTSFNNKQDTSNSYAFNLGKHKNDRKKIKPYEKGDNDFYWFNLGKKVFYVIPEAEMIKYGYLMHTDIPGKTAIELHLEQGKYKGRYKDWSFAYRFEYSSVDFVKLLDLVSNNHECA